jgi:hypothetical protein
MTYYLTPAPLLALRTVTYCTENEWTPFLTKRLKARTVARKGESFTTNP